MPNASMATRLPGALSAVNISNSRSWASARQVGQQALGQPCGRLGAVETRGRQRRRPVVAQVHRRRCAGRRWEPRRRFQDGRSCIPAPGAGRSRRPRYRPANPAGRPASPARRPGSPPAGSRRRRRRRSTRRRSACAPPGSRMPSRCARRPCSSPSSHASSGLGQPRPRAARPTTPTVRANSSRISGSAAAVSTARDAATPNAVAPTTFGDGPAVAVGTHEDADEAVIEISHSATPCYPNKLGNLCALCATSLRLHSARCG